MSGQAYLFSCSSLDWVEGGMLKPVAVVQVVEIEQLGKGVDVAHLLEAVLLDDAGAVEGHWTRVLGRGTRSGLSGQLRHLVERPLVGQQIPWHLGGRSAGGDRFRSRRDWAQKQESGPGRERSAVRTRCAVGEL